MHLLRQHDLAVAQPQPISVSLLQIFGFETDWMHRTGFDAYTRQLLAWWRLADAQSGGLVLFLKPTEVIPMGCGARWTMCIGPVDGIILNRGAPLLCPA